MIEFSEALFNELGIVIAVFCVVFPFVVAFEDIEFARSCFPLLVRCSLSLSANSFLSTGVIVLRLGAHLCEADIPVSSVRKALVSSFPDASRPSAPLS